MANNDSTKRVPLELLCMLILKEGDRYGYEMVQEIESRSGGLLSFNLASVYVALRRLEERGCVSSRTEMTDAARARIELEESKREIERLTRQLELLEKGEHE